MEMLLSCQIASYKCDKQMKLMFCFIWKNNIKWNKKMTNFWNFKLKFGKISTNENTKKNLKKNENCR